MSKQKIKICHRGKSNKFYSYNSDYCMNRNRVSVVPKKQTIEKQSIIKRFINFVKTFIENYKYFTKG